MRKEQIERIKLIKATRNPESVQYALKNITDCAFSGQGNLLELAIIAAKERATLGEISKALETAFGRFTAVGRTISGIYSNEIKMDEKFKTALALSDQFAAMEGRRPRIMIAKLGQDGHDRGAEDNCYKFCGPCF